MNTKIINGTIFADLIRLGAINLSENKEIVNELNVFPVPDGDTGENMFMTINAAAISEDIDDPVSLEKISETVAHEALLGARGNSGVILSRIFAGISNGFKGKIEASVDEFDSAMKCGLDEAYKAVAKPVEGTILTVLKDSVNFAHNNKNHKTTFEQYFEDLVSEMKKSVDRTPDLLPSLKEAGVVDSGGVGLLFIFEGMKKAFDGTKIDDNFLKTRKNPNEELDISLFSEDSELEFGYCVEFLLRLQTKKVDIDSFNINEFTDFLRSVGESVVCFQDKSVVKVHIHLKNPGDILNYCQTFGEFLKIKIENMSLQHNNSIIRNQYDDFKTNQRKKYGLVCVANSNGIIEAFKEIGCDEVIDGGKTMNPSTNDFLDAFDKVNAETIFVFPNNKNVIMAAEQAKKVSDKKVIIINTKTIGEGYAAISNFDSSIENIEDVTKILNETIESTITGIVSKSSRDTTANGLNIKSGDYIGFSNNKILVTSEKPDEALIELADSLKTETFDIAIVFCGANIKEEDRKKIEKIFCEKKKRTECFVLNGGQPVYDYILILE